MTKQQELHDLYDKHDYKLIGRINSIEVVGVCSCGAYAWKGPIYEKYTGFTNSTTGDWIHRTYLCLPEKYGEGFLQYLRDIEWECDNQITGALVWKNKWMQHQDKTVYSPVNRRRFLKMLKG